jgi:hypothetical protein
MTVPFQLDIFSTSGKPVATVPDHGGEAISLHEWTTWLRVRSDISGFVAPPANPDTDEDVTGWVPPAFEEDGLAVMVVARQFQDVAGKSIGLFHNRLDARELEQLSRAVELTPWAELPRPVGGDWSAAHILLRYSRGDLLIERRFNARSANFLEAIAPLWQLITQRMSMVRNRPAGTLEIAVRREGDSLHLVLENNGLDAIVLTDPRVPSELPRLQVKVRPTEPPLDDEPPFDRLVPIPALPASEPSTLVLRPKRRFELSLPWQESRPGKYIVRATWRDYGGPIQTVAHQLPFMPLPQTGPSLLGSGPYPIRGAVFASRMIEIADEKAKKSP